MGQIRVGSVEAAGPWAGLGRALTTGLHQLWATVSAALSLESTLSARVTLTLPCPTLKGFMITGNSLTSIRAILNFVCENYSAVN